MEFMMTLVAQGTADKEQFSPTMALLATIVKKRGAAGKGCYERNSYDLTAITFIHRLELNL